MAHTSPPREGPAANWGKELSGFRRGLHLSRHELATLSNVSAPTIKAYETGSRHPTRPLLVALLDALKLERTARNRLLMAAGFAPDGWVIGPDGLQGYMFDSREATEFVKTFRWPAFVMNDALEVVGVNALCEKLWGIDFEREFTTPLDRNMLRVASNPRFADKINWDEMVSVAIAVFKGHHRGAEDVEQGSPYFTELLGRFMEGDPKYVNRFFELWQSTAPRDPKVRWSYPVVWTEPGVGVLRFEAVVNTASAPDGLAFNDWIPLDAETWEALGILAGR